MSAQLAFDIEQTPVERVVGQHVFEWTVWITCPTTPALTCQPTVESIDYRCRHWEAPRAGWRWAEVKCHCVGDLMFRGACRHCDWRGTASLNENRAVEDGHDHAHPGWRALPTVEPAPEDDKKIAKWVAAVAAVYPAGWLERGGPIRTHRSALGTRHVPGRTPHGGYDMWDGKTPGGAA